MRFSVWLVSVFVAAGCEHNTSFKAEWELTFLGEPLVDEAALWIESSVDPAEKYRWNGQSNSLVVKLRDLPVREGWVQMSGLADDYQLCEVIDGETYYPLNVLNVTLIMSVPWTKEVTISETGTCVMTYIWGQDVTQLVE